MTAEKGFSDAITDVIGGIIVGAVLSVMPEVLQSIPSVPSYYSGIFQLVGIAIFVSGLLVILAMESWKFMYLLGWLFGMGIMYYVGLVEPWLFILYAIVGIIVLVIKALRKSGY